MTRWSGIQAILRKGVRINEDPTTFRLLCLALMIVLSIGVLDVHTDTCATERKLIQSTHATVLRFSDACAGAWGIANPNES